MGGKEQISTGKLMYTYLCAEIISDGELTAAPWGPNGVPNP